MKRYQLGLAVREPEYMKRVADYIRDSAYAGQWQVAAFTHADACRQYVQQGFALDLIAAEPHMLDELRDDLPQLPLAALVGKPGESGVEHELLQYQPLPRLLQEINELHSRLSGRRPESEAGLGSGEGAKVIALHSIAGGVGKTALALHLVHAAGSREKRTFYLNMERWNSSGLWLKHAERNERVEGLSGLLYAVKAHQDKPEQAMEWLRQHRVFDPMLKGHYLPAFANADDRLALAPEDAAAMLAAVKQSGQYDVIVVDMAGGLDDVSMSLFEQADRVLMLLTERQSDMQKHELAMRYGHMKWGAQFQNVINKAELVSNMAAGGNAAAGKFGGRQDSVRGERVAPVSFPWIEAWRGGSGPALLLSSPLFRAAADRLYKHLAGEGERVHAV